MTDTTALQTQALNAITASTSLDELEALRVQWLGKKGELTAALKTLKDLSIEEKKTQGAALNVVKQTVAAAIDTKKTTLETAALNARLDEEYTDLSLPARPELQGSLHPITQVMDEVVSIFGQLGFQVAHGPDIEDDFHNFTALNIPAHHPARQMHDTFYLKAEDGKDAPVLRTHTSPVQVRAMRSGKPPFRVIAPGSTFRCDSDATHTPMFHQVEGLVIDKNIHMGHLKGTLSAFLKAFFAIETVPMRFRNSYFPFTEPSAEVDIACKKSKDGVLIGEGDDWLEILGCGMVHPNVLESCDLDPNEWQGFAFGMGIERLAMLKYGMADLRPFYESDLRWLQHYGFAPTHRPSLNWGLVA